MHRQKVSDNLLVSRILTNTNLLTNYKLDAPPSQPAPSLGQPPTTSHTIVGGASGLLLLVGIASGTALVLINILLIGCCLHKRTQKRIKRGKGI